MFLLLAEVLNFTKVHEALPASGLWAFLSHHQSHVLWAGCALHDLIQPFFSFLVGVALPFSIASRVAKGESFGVMVFHALRRSLVLVFLGIFLRSMASKQTYFTFEDTLTQIGLGYFFLFLLGFRSMKVQVVALGVVLVGYFLAFVFYTAPAAALDVAQTGVAQDWVHNYTGFAAHWNKNTNLAWAFDRWFLNLFPRESPFLFNEGGYCTLSFIPTLGTMILGLIAGGKLKRDEPQLNKLRFFLVVGVGLLALGGLLHFSGVCPVVKRIWTPAWTIFSGGWCFLLLALFYGLVDYFQTKGWYFFFMVSGANSIAAYLMVWTLEGFIGSSLSIHLGGHYSEVFGAAYSTLVTGGLTIFLEWLILYWMYRKRIYLKI